MIGMLLARSVIRRGAALGVAAAVVSLVGVGVGAGVASADPGDMLKEWCTRYEPDPDRMSGACRTAQAQT